MKSLEGTFNQEKALVGAFSITVKSLLEALVPTLTQGNLLTRVLLQVTAAQVESLLGEAELCSLHLHPMMEGDDLLECHLGEEDSAEVHVKKESLHL